MHKQSTSYERALTRLEKALAKLEQTPCTHPLRQAVQREAEQAWVALSKESKP